jgi:hypothetical protein
MTVTTIKKPVDVSSMTKLQLQQVVASLEITYKRGDNKGVLVNKINEYYENTPKAEVGLTFPGEY